METWKIWYGCQLYFYGLFVFYVHFHAFPVIPTCHNDEHELCIFEFWSSLDFQFGLLGMERSQGMQRASHGKFYLGRIEDIRLLVF